MNVTRGASAPCKQCGEVVTNLALLEIRNLHVALEDGTETDVHLDKAFNVLGSEAEAESGSDD